MTGLNFNIANNNLPWLQPCMPVFNPGFDVPQNFFSFGSNSSSSIVQTDLSTMSVDEYHKHREKKFAEKAKLKTETKALLIDNSKELEKINSKLKNLEKGKQADGTVNFIDDFENISTGKKLMMAGMNMLDGVGNVCKSLIGFDKDGKWNPVKCLTNVGIAVGVGALCFYAAPLGAIVATKLGGGATALLIGKTIAATKVILPTIGVASGVLMTARGVYNTCKADTLEEFDKGTQQIGQGMFIGLSSAAGLRGVSKTAGLVTKGTGLFSNIGAALKNTFVNPWKAVGAEFTAAQSAITAATTNAASAGNNIGFFNKLQIGKNEVKALHRNENYKITTQKRHETRKLLSEKLADVRKEIATTTDSKEKALLKMQEDILTSQRDLLTRAKSRKEWIDLRKSGNISKQIGYKWYHKFGIKGNQNFKINNENFTAKELRSLMKGLKADQKNVIKPAIKELITLKLNQAFKYGQKPKDYGLSTKWYAAPWNWVKTKLGIGITKGEVLMNAFSIACPWYLLQPIVRNACFQPINVMTSINPTYNPTLGDVLTAEDYAKKQEELNAQLVELQAKNDEYKNILANA